MKPILFILTAGVILAACRSSKPSKQGWDTIILKGDTVTKAEKPLDSVGIYNNMLRHKYAGYLSVSEDSISNLTLYKFIDKWLHTPYLWGGTNEKGIDCSAFIQRLLADVYNIEIPRTSIQQFFTRSVEPFSGKHYLTEGDLVFFRTTKGKLISHVGLYLANHKFINAAVSNGVSIASLNDPYWKARYVAAGRVKVNKGLAVHNK